MDGQFAFSPLAGPPNLRRSADSRAAIDRPLLFREFFSIPIELQSHLLEGHRLEVFDSTENLRIGPQAEVQPIGIDETGIFLGHPVVLNFLTGFGGHELVTAQGQVSPNGIAAGVGGEIVQPRISFPVMSPVVATCKCSGSAVFMGNLS